eukprot:TRINITY_DN11764_c0_g3_i1.p1 TRINITY_DN11764_c0_g3~~TRINITY_DN11764_c0_g3_i1.p1  ORF type:complete len:224 (+),score=47.62 TRINITY_DN11764_c0_g3_i1:101-772(+)
MGTKRPVLWYLGNIFRETGLAIDRLGCRFQGNYSFREQLSRHRSILDFYNKQTLIAPSAYISPTASVIGAVDVGQNSRIWYGAVVRGDVYKIEIGDNTDIGNRVVIHVRSEDTGKQGIPTFIGSNVLVEDGSVLHGCTLGDECKIGAGSIILDGAIIEKNAMIGPGSLVTSGKRVASGQFWAGSPARYVRDVTKEEKEDLLKTLNKQHEAAAEHKQQHDRKFN